MTRKNRLKQKVQPAATILAAVGDVSRLAIVYALAHQPMDVREIIDITGITGSLMSHHLNILYKAGWVTKRKYGKRIEYSLQLSNHQALAKLLKGTFVWREQIENRMVK